MNPGGEPQAGGKLMTETEAWEAVRMLGGLPASSRAARWQELHGGVPLWRQVQAWALCAPWYDRALSEGYTKTGDQCAGYVEHLSKTMGQPKVFVRGRIMVYEWSGSLTSKRVGFEQAPAYPEAAGYVPNLWRQVPAAELKRSEPLHSAERLAATPCETHGGSYLECGCPTIEDRIREQPGGEEPARELAAFEFTSKPKERAIKFCRCGAELDAAGPDRCDRCNRRTLCRACTAFMVRQGQPGDVWHDLPACADPPSSRAARRQQERANREACEVYNEIKAEHAEPDPTPPQPAAPAEEVTPTDSQGSGEAMPGPQPADGATCATGAGSEPSGDRELDFARAMLERGTLTSFLDADEFCGLCGFTIPLGEEGWLHPKGHRAHDECVARKLEPELTEGEAIAFEHRRQQRKLRAAEPFIRPEDYADANRAGAAKWLKAVDMETVRLQRTSKKGYRPCEICMKPVTKGDEWVSEKGKNTKRAHLSCADELLQELAGAK